MSDLRVLTVTAETSLSVPETDSKLITNDAAVGLFQSMSALQIRAEIEENVPRDEKGTPGASIASVRSCSRANDAKVSMLGITIFYSLRKFYCSLSHSETSCQTLFVESQTSWQILPSESQTSWQILPSESQTSWQIVGLLIRLYLLISTTQCKTSVGRSFAYAVPTMEYTTSADIRCAQSDDSFKKQLKTNLHKKAHTIGLNTFLFCFYISF